MNGGILPLLLICATIGLALSTVSRRSAWFALGGMAAAAALASLIPVDPVDSMIVFAGLWISMIAAAVLLFLPRAWSSRVAVPVAIAGGASAGLVAALSEMRWALLLALPLLLLFVPGQFIASRGYEIALKVAASWMIAIASLSLFVSLMPHPGYVPDHME